MEQMRKRILEKLFGLPAEMLEKGVEVGEEIGRELGKEKPVRAVKEYWKTLGPGLTTGAADDDPSGIATYSQMGASRGYGMLWLAAFTFPLMGVVQEMCARIGLATGAGLAANIRKLFPRRVLYICASLLVFANVFNIGADLGAMSQATQLLFPNAPFPFLVIAFALFSLTLQIFVPYKVYSKYLKYLTLILFTYIISALAMNLDWGEIIYNAAIPHISFSKQEIILLCAALGTTISPYLFFWQTSQEVEEQIDHGENTEALRRASTTTGDIKKMRIDVWSGMFISNLVMFFIIVACAAALNGSGITDIRTAADAAQALRPFAGDLSYFLFTAGILGTGLLAIPVLAGSASYALSESLGFRFGLYRKLREATAFYGIIMLSMFAGIALNFIGLDPIKALIYSAVLNGLIAPIIIFFILRIAVNKKVMGNWVNSAISTWLGWLIFALMASVGVATLLFIF